MTASAPASPPTSARAAGIRCLFVGPTGSGKTWAAVQALPGPRLILDAAGGCGVLPEEHQGPIYLLPVHSPADAASELASPAGWGRRCATVVLDGAEVWFRAASAPSDAHDPWRSLVTALDCLAEAGVHVVVTCASVASTVAGPTVIPAERTVLDAFGTWADVTVRCGHAAQGFDMTVLPPPGRPAGTRLGNDSVAALLASPSAAFRCALILALGRDHPRTGPEETQDEGPHGPAPKGPVR